MPHVSHAGTRLVEFLLGVQRVSPGTGLSDGLNYLTRTSCVNGVPAIPPLLGVIETLHLPARSLTVHLALRLVTLTLHRPETVFAFAELPVRLPLTLEARIEYRTPSIGTNLADTELPLVLRLAFGRAGTLAAG